MPSCVGRAPRTRELARRCLPGSGEFQAPAVCPVRVIWRDGELVRGVTVGRAAAGGSGRAGAAVVVLPGAVWGRRWGAEGRSAGRAGGARDSPGNVPEHPSTSCLLPCPVLSTLGLER